MTRRTLHAALVGLGFLGLQACAASSNTDAPVDEQTEQMTEKACVPGHQTQCACAGDASGLQVCNDEGTAYGACDCPEMEPEEEEETFQACGDGVCADDETCDSCAADCGTCIPCDIAPSCENAAIAPANVPHAADLDVPKMDMLDAHALQQRIIDFVSADSDATRVLAASLDPNARFDEHPYVTALRKVWTDNPEQADVMRHQLSVAGMGSPADYRIAHPERRVDPIRLETHDVVPPGGTMECGAPLLRMGVSSITVHEEDDDIANDIVYCVIQAEAGTGSEVRVTPKTPNLDEGESHNFSLEAGIFWGQQGPTTPGGNVLVTYDCIEADNSDAYQDLINSIGNASSQIGNVVEGDNGWIFTTVGALAPVVSSGLALNGDDQLFNAQQTIELSKQMELTNGAYWTVRRDGTHILSDWDWELTIKAWGCAENGTL